MALIEKIRRLCRTSLLICLLMRLCNAVYACLKDGLFGRFFTAYSAEEKKFRSGKFGKFLSRRGRTATWVRKFRLRLAEFFEKSLIISTIARVLKYLLGCSFRFYSIVLLFFGIYSGLIYWVRQYVLIGSEPSNGTLVISMASIALSFLMMGSRGSLAELLTKGLITHSVLIDILGIPEDRMDIPRTKDGGKYLYAILLGSILGLITLIVPSMHVLLAVLCLIAVALVMTYPEIGAFVLIVLLPFFFFDGIHARFLDIAILAVSIAYLGKLIRGKRIFRLNLIDAAVLSFGILLLMSGIVSVGGGNSLDRAMQICLMMLTYFVIVNLIRTPAWLHRSVLALVTISAALALIGVWQYLLEVRESGDWAGATRVFSTFESPEVFSSYLMLILPFWAAMLATSTGTKQRVLALGGGSFLVCALILARSRSAWVGALVALVFFFLIYSKKTVIWLLIGGTTVPIWFGFLPATWQSYLLNLADLSDPAIYQRLYTWRGSVRMLREHLLGGIGYGTDAFQEVYPMYSYAGLESAKNAGSFYLTLFAAVGLMGILVFAFLVIVFLQHCFEYIGNASEDYSRTLVAAGFSAIVGTWVAGFVSDIWFNEAIMLTFFAILALTCAYVRAGVVIRTRNQDVSGIDVSHAHVNIHFEV